MEEIYNLNSIFIGDINIVDSVETSEQKTNKKIFSSFLCKSICANDGENYLDLVNNLKIKKYENIYQINDYFLSNKISFKEYLNENDIQWDKNIVTKQQILNLYKCLKVYKKNNDNRTLAIIKPDGMKNIDKIIDMIYKKGLKIDRYEVRILDKEVLKDHYHHLLNKSFYPELEYYMTSGPVAIMILTGEDAVKKLRDLMGPTDSKKAEKGTIRGDFGTDITKNAIHGSDSKENANIEINRFFKEKKKVLSNNL